MELWNWFTGLFKSDGTLNIDMYTGELAGEIFYRELAIRACINLIANTIGACEFLTYENGKKIQKENYYLFNVEANQNKSASQFWRSIIHNLIYQNECLVIQYNGMFYVADSFDVDNFAFNENIYKNVVIDNLELQKTFRESEVFYFKLHNEKIRTVIDGLYESYSKLIKVSSSNYKKNNSRRGSLKIPTSYPQTEQAQKDLEKLLGERFKRFFDAEGGAVIPLTNGLEYTELSSNIGQKTSGADGREIRLFIDDIFDFTAMGFQIPPQLIKGNLADTDKAMNNFLMFCIKPLVKMIIDEINRKLYGKKAFLERSYVKADTTKIKVVDLQDIANALEILTRIGAYCVDDSLQALGLEPLNTEWSRARWMTKNYEHIEKMRGGETDG